MFEAIAELYNLTTTLFFRGGWIVFALGLLAMFYWLYMDRINIRWYKQQEWVFLKVSVPPENEKSPLAFEQIFSQMHSLETTKSFKDLYVDGVVQLWMTWEITSIGGKIGHFVRIPKDYRDLLEAAVYSQYPDAEIEETDDYFDRLPPYDPETSEYDIFAWSNKLVKDDPYPIRTYLDYEHSTTDTFIDPLEGLWEALGNLNEYEMFVVQYLFQPVKNDWKERGYHLVKKLKGEPEANRPKFFRELGLINLFLDPILDAIIRSDAEAPPQREEPPSMMLHLSEGEKKVIEAIERNLSKWGYATKVRCLYLAPKARFNRKGVAPGVVGAFKSLGAHDLNSLKPDLKHWTKVDPLLSDKYEKSLVEFRTKWRKRKYFRIMKDRFFYDGAPPFVFNTEEMATICHFPRTEVTVPDIARVPVTKEKAPADLPVASDFNL